MPHYYAKKFEVRLNLSTVSGMVLVTVVLSVVEVCADYGGVNVFHVCLNFGIFYCVGVCVNVCGVVCVVVCLFLTSGCCLFLTSGCCLL